MASHRQSRGAATQARPAVPDPPTYSAAPTRTTHDRAKGHDRQTPESQGTFRLDKVTYLVGGQHGYHHVLLEIDGDTISVIDNEGEILAEHTRPAPGITYVGNGRPPGPRPKTGKPAPKY